MNKCHSKISTQTIKQKALCNCKGDSPEKTPVENKMVLCMNEPNKVEK